MKRNPASLVLVLVGAAIYAAGCGGGQAQSQPAQSGSSGGGGGGGGGGGSSDGQAQKQDDPPPTSPEGQAQQKFAALSKEIEKLGKGDPVNVGWLDKELQGVLKLHPEHNAAQFNLAVLKERSGDKKGAREIYEAIVDRAPDFAPANENLATYLVADGKSQEAVGLYRKNIEKDPKNVTSRLALARLLASEKQYEEAITLCRQALQRQADAIEAFRVLAKSYNALGNTPMAELIIARGLKVNKEDAELHYLLAQILLDKKELAAGVNKLKQVVTMDPKRLNVRAQLAEIALSYRDFGNAAAQYEAIVKQAPHSRPALIGLAVSYKGMGRYDQSEKLYQQILQQNANDGDVLWNVAVLYHRHLHRFDDAIAFYKRAKEALPQGDEKIQQVDKLVTEAEKTKNDLAAQKDRQEREKKKLEAIEAACAAVKAGKKADAEAIGAETERIEVGWQLMVNAQAMVQEGDVPSGETLVKCALEIIPDTPGAKVEACAPMRNMWTQILYQLNRLEDALANTKEALKCDPNNPDAQLIEQQLAEIIKQQAAAPPPAEGQPAPAAPQK